MGSRDGIEPLLPRVAAGEPEAVEQCIDRYSPLVWAIVRQAIASAENAEDLVQEVFIDLWRSADRFDPERGAERTFVGTLARRRVIDRLRAAGRAPESAPLEGVEAPDQGRPLDQVDDRDEVVRVVEALAQLSEGQQRVLRLTLFEERTHTEIADLTGMPLGTVKTHARRGLKKLGSLLEPPPAADGG